MKRILGFVAILVATAVLFACSGDRKSSQASVQPTLNSLGASHGIGAPSDDARLARLSEIDLEEVLAEIAEYPAPAGADASDFEMLRLALATKITELVLARDVSKPPEGLSGKVTTLAYSDDKLIWQYTNAGDYNQDGQVTVADIFEVAVLLGAKVGDGVGDDAREAWVDGSGDGEIGVSDITPVAANYLASIAGYHVYFARSMDSIEDHLIYVEFERAVDAWPKRFEITKSDITYYSNYWPGLYICVAPIDPDEIEGERSDIFQMTEIVPQPHARDLFGITGRLVQAVSYLGFSPEPPDKDEIETTYEWDFGGGAEPNTSTENDPYVSLGAPGHYTGSLTATNKYGTATDNFDIQVLTVATPKPDSIWIDAYNEGPDNYLILDVYACRITKPFEVAELKIVFEADENTPGFADNHSYSRYPWRYGEPTSNPGGQAIGRIEGEYFCIYISASVELNPDQGNSGVIASIRTGMSIPSARPVSVTLSAYPYIEEDNFDSYTINKWDGYFDYEAYTGTPPPYYQCIGQPALARPDMSVEYLQGAGVGLSFTGGIKSDLNGDNIVDLYDINIIAVRYLAQTDDGILDEIDLQADGDGNGEINVSDIGSIATHYKSSVTSFRIFRDGALIGEIPVECPYPRTSIVHLWPRLTFVDAHPPSGAHYYSFCAYNALGDTESEMSKPVLVLIE